MILDALRALFTNKVLICALIAWFIAQVLKTIIELVTNKTVSLKRLFGDGGMPSGHSACVSALAVSSAILYGFDSPVFAIAGVLAVIVMHDATGVRQESGKQAKEINQIKQTLSPIYDEIDDKMLKELLGHNHLQVIAGSILGIIVGIVAALLIK